MNNVEPPSTNVKPVQPKVTNTHNENGVKFNFIPIKTKNMTDGEKAKKNGFPKNPKPDTSSSPKSQRGFISGTYIPWNPESTCMSIPRLNYK